MNTASLFVARDNSWFGLSREAEILLLVGIIQLKNLRRRVCADVGNWMGESQTEDCPIRTNGTEDGDIHTIVSTRQTRCSRVRSCLSS